jgi:ComF family protein
VEDLKTWFVAALFTPKCVKCGKEGAYLCIQHRDLPPAPESQAVFEFLDEIMAGTPYSHPVSQKIVTHFKFQGQKHLVKVMAPCMLQSILKSGNDEINLVPIPLHWTRRWWRGFNQAEQLAVALQSLQPKWNLVPGLKRIRRTKQQAKLTRENRLENLKSAFVWDPKFPIPEKVVLIDDVVATGATLDQAARILKAVGVRKVQAVVFARGGS